MTELRRFIDKVLSHCVAGILIASASAAGDLQIVYGHAGLTKVEVTERNQLQFSWHTGRLPFEKGGSAEMRASLEAYDSHSATIWLTKSELTEFRNWIEKSTILGLKSRHPEPEMQTYGSTFHSSLTVSLDGKKHALAWTGHTKVPDSLHEAVNKLVEMCHRIRKSRERR